MGDAEQSRDRVPVDVGVDQAYLVPGGGELYGEVGGHRALAHAAFAGGDGDDLGE